MKIIYKIVSLFACVAVLGASGAEVRPPWQQFKAVAHALGGIQGFTYTNSREALELNYKRGHRVFEVDLQMTSDGVMVARHDWGQALADLLEQPFDPDRPILSYDDFSKQKIYKKFTPICLREIAEFMAANADVWLVTDTKTTTEDGAAADFETLVKIFKTTAPSALSRVIPQIYNQRMLKAIRTIFPFDNIIYTLYQTDDGDDSVISFCQANGISVVTMPPARASESFVAKLNAAGVHSFVHTINNSAEVRQLLRRGVRGIYTDFLVPADWELEQ